MTLILVAIYWLITIKANHPPTYTYTPLPQHTHNRSFSVRWKFTRSFWDTYLEHYRVWETVVTNIKGEKLKT